MRRKIPILFLSIMTLLSISCSDDTTGGDDPEALEFSAEPSDGLSSIIQETPSDFTWDYYQNNVQVSMIPGSGWSGDITLSAFQVENGEVVNRTTTEPVETTADELSAGLSTEEMFPGSQWFPGSEWVPGDSWFPGLVYVPGNSWTPSEIEQRVIADHDLGENETMVVVYAQLAGDSPEREQATQPFGMVMMKEEPKTGTLEAITTTSGGSDDSGYTLTVNGANSTAMDTADTASVSDLDEGNHQAELTDIPSDCSIDGDNPRTVNITAGETTTTTFKVSCQSKLANQIVFHTGRHGNAEIYAMDADGSNKQRLTNNSDFDSSPVISNDGSQIAFVSGRDGGQHLFVMNADGSGIQQVTTATTDPGFHTWSPDDSQLAFADYDNGRDIFKVNTDGSGRTQLTNNGADDAFPTWSPDGNKIAFVSDRNGNDFEYQIFTMDTDGNNIQQITSGVTLNSYAPAPRWSPDGSKLVFATDNGSIVTVDSNGNNLQQVTNDTEMDRTPTWSPDGSEIAFERNDDIYKINADGSGSVSQLTTDSGSDIEPFWSPVE